MQNDHGQQTITSNGMPLGSAASPTRIIPTESQGENHTHRQSEKSVRDEIPHLDGQLLSVNMLDKIEIDLEQGKGVPLASADKDLLSQYRTALPILIKSYKMQHGLPLRQKAEINDERTGNAQPNEIRQ